MRYVSFSVVVLALLALPARSFAQGAPVITSAVPAVDMSSLFVAGSGFGTDPVVTLEGRLLPVLAGSDATLVVELPQLAPGTYLLEVRTGNGPKRSVAFSVALPATGPKGDPGAPGPAGPPADPAALDARYARLAAPNLFTANQRIAGTLFGTAVFAGSTTLTGPAVRAISSTGSGVHAESSTGSAVWGRSAFASGIIGNAGQNPHSLGVIGNSYPSSTSNGVMGIAHPDADGRASTGVIGQSNATVGFTTGVAGYAERSPDGIGVVARGGRTGLFARGTVHGVEVDVPGTAPCAGCPAGFFAAAVNANANHEFAYAVHGHNRGANGTGVRGFASGPGGTGVDGFATNGGSAGSFWLQGAGTIIKGGGPGGNFSVDGNGAAWFSGGVSAGGHGTMNDLTVTGTLVKSGGSFRIDHPLDPENKYLSHSFVESPDMKNIYDGVTSLDAKGEAVVALPSYFEALNIDFRYQLTTIGGFAQVYIAEEVRDGRFRIAGGKPGMKVSWQVTGTRNDAWARANRIPVEENKR